MTQLLDTIDGIVWGPAMLVLILGTGLYLQIRLRGMPIMMIGQGLRMMWKGRKGDAGHGEVSPFSALMTCLAATIGVGNVVGVATAVALGGPGAVFWMWMTALVGMATKYAEVVVAVQFRERDEDGRYVGGPMYAIRNGMKKNWKWLGTAFAVFGGLAGFGIGNMVQANSIADAVEDAFGIGNTVTGITLVVITGAVVLGGIKRIAAIADWLVPFMAGAYVFGGLAVLVTHIANNRPTGGGSDDIGDIMWTVPTITIGYPSNIAGTTGHHVTAAMAMATPIAHKGAVAGAKAVGLTLLDLMMTPELLAEAKDYFDNVQTKEMKYAPVLGPDDMPGIHLNKDLMDRLRPEMSKYYYDPDRYDSYLEQLGIAYPPVE